ncbi:endoglycosylceramidase [Entomortierella parvispora]|uniref:Endoglycosylceramidase n=1 Tax=Entomortierella parvispora TaxID=205924 RepID=A0A9P3LX76_9FUNG|nr:endoglycosylceramidase [Entomortierella parvispora]
MMSTNEQHLPKFIIDPSSEDSSPTAPGEELVEESEEPSVSFRHHHSYLRPQELKHANSFSSMSSYASSEDDEDDRSPGTTTFEQEQESQQTETQLGVSSPSSTRKSLSRTQSQRPGGGTSVRPAGKAHDWYSGGRITSHGRWFRDSQNRTLLLRGVNLCGNSKLPTTPNGSSHLSEGFFDHRNVCFLGRPFPLDQAHEHFSRLQRWGLTFVRMLVPWEALEHSGPGIYDEKFIDSLIELIKIMPKYGIKCFIDPHQDCWSRFSGGSGAPGWTFEVAGLDLTKFKTTGAAYVHNTNQFPGDSPPMVWPTNYTKLAASTMFTLFWAGDTFAPNKMYQGESIQQFLQNRYLECYQHLASRLSHLDSVIGFEVMNEPHPGYVGLKNLKRYDFNSNLFFGDSPSALESFALGDGMPLSIEVWVKSWPFPTKKQRTRIINSQKDSAWLDGECLWKQHGVWSVNPKTGEPQLDRPNYFTTDPITGEKVDFTRFYLDFMNRYSHAIQSVLPSAFVFVGPIPNEPAPVWGPGDHEENIVYAPHWYDLHSIFNKSFDGRITHDVQGLSKGKNVISATYFGIKGAKKNYRGQLANVLNYGLQNVGNKPCLIGECGIPMDINQRQAFLSGDYGYHAKFLDAVLSAMESNLLSFTLWNYNTTNDNTHGDHWNGEDFSIFSLDSPKMAGDSPVGSLRQQAPSFAKEVMKRAALESAAPLDDDTDVSYKDSDNEIETLGIEDDSPFDRAYFSFDHEESDDGRDHVHHIGGRALDAVVRPYAAKVAGEPLSSEFDFVTLQYTFRFSNYLQAPVPTVRVSTPEQSLTSSKSADSSDSTLTSGQEGTAGGLEKELQDKSSLWVGHPPEGTQLAFETEIFIPSYHYDDAALEILVSDGDWRYVKERQTLYYRHKDMEPGAVHSVRIKAISGPTTAVMRKQSKHSLKTIETQSDMESGVLRRRGSSPTMKISGSADNKAEGPSGCICGIM